MADAPVFIAQYDAAWLAGFDGQRDRVAAVLEPWLAAPVEHIGSTSVPGLPAKPVVDMLAPVRPATACPSSAPGQAARETGQPVPARTVTELEPLLAT